jgi:RNA polymerase sigma-70 factor (ECF subfamily)
LREPTDAELIRDSLEDPSSFEGVFRRHYQPVRRYLQARLGIDVGEELAAQTFLIAFDRRQRYDERYASARPWLFAIATNLERHQHRGVRRRRAALQREAATMASSWEIDDDRVSASAAAPQIHAALEALEERDRAALMLYAVADLSYDDVAAALGIPVGTVRSRINRARRVLRERFPELGAITSVIEDPDTERGIDHG